MVSMLQPHALWTKQRQCIGVCTASLTRCALRLPHTDCISCFDKHQTHRSPACGLDALYKPLSPKVAVAPEGHPERPRNATPAWPAPVAAAPHIISRIAAAVVRAGFAALLWPAPACGAMPATCRHAAPAAASGACRAAAAAAAAACGATATAGRGVTAAAAIAAMCGATGAARWRGRGAWRLWCAAGAVATTGRAAGAAATRAAGAAATRAARSRVANLAVDIIAATVREPRRASVLCARLGRVFRHACSATALGAGGAAAEVSGAARLRVRWSKGRLPRDTRPARAIVIYIKAHCCQGRLV